MGDEPFDWRGYARSVRVTPLDAWLACQKAMHTGYPHGVRVTSPASLDLICEDDAMHDVVRAVIDDAKERP